MSAPAPERSGFARLYGDRPRHLMLMVALLALTAYVASRLFLTPAWLRVAIWFVGVAVVWDLVLGPLMALADRGLQALSPRLRGVPVLNFVRVPALVSALLLLVFAPLVLQRSEGVYAAKAGLSQAPFLGRWLAVTAVLFAVSALLLAWRVARARR